MHDPRLDDLAAGQSLAIAGDDVDDLLDAAVLHATSKHGHADGPELREGIRSGLEPADAAMT